MRIRAQFEHDIVRDITRLYVVRELPDKAEVLMEDGTWQTVEYGVDPGSPAGFPLPAAAIFAIAEAAAKYLGNTLPSQAEVAVLREVLAKEQGRVDAVLADATLMPRRTA